ncbi:MAG TPA: hypothetical protein VF576_10255 [Rubricoccaceae bacterium]|jgi:hypothetical protein
MPTYSNDPGAPGEPPPRRRPDLPEPPPRNVPPPAYVPPHVPPPAYVPVPAGPERSDNRPLLIAGVIALVALVAIVGYYLLVYVPARDARAAEGLGGDVPVQTERPPGALAEGDGFRPSVIEADPTDDVGTRLDDVPQPVGDDPDDAAPGLEQPPNRAPRPATPPAQTPDVPAPAAAPVPPAPTSRPEHVDFAEEYLDRQAGNSVSYALGLYATTVRYYDRGRVSADEVGRDKEAYFARFPNRRYALASPVRVVSGTAGGAATLRFDYTYALGGAGRDRSGRAWVELDVVPSGGTFLVQGERGDVY